MAAESTLPPPADVGVFWDFENVRIPDAVSAASASNKIRVAAGSYGMIRERKLYYDSQKASERNTDRRSLDSCGFTLVDCPARHAKEAIDKKLIVDIMTFGLEAVARRQPCYVVLITSDGDYCYTLSKLRDRGVQTVVIYGPMTQMSNDLFNASDVARSWNDVLGVTPSAVESVPASDEEQAAAEEHLEVGELDVLAIDDATPEDASMTMKDDELLLFLHCVRQHAGQLNVWVKDWLIAKEFHAKRGGYDKEKYRAAKQSAQRRKFIHLDRRERQTPSGGVEPGVEVWLRLSDTGLTQLEEGPKSAKAISNPSVQE